MEGLMNGMPIFWLALLVVSLVIELATMQLTTIWFAGGALAALLLSLFTGNIALQTAVFLIVSLLLLIFTRPFAMKFVNRNRTKTNADRLIGQTAVVIETINNLAAKGQIQVCGQVWTARAKEEKEIIPAGSNVKVLEIAGVKLIVELAEEDREETPAR